MSILCLINMTCTRKELKRDLYIREKDEISDIILQGTTITKEDHIKYARNVKIKKLKQEITSDLTEWYPFVNSYYPFGNYTDPLERVQHLLDAKPSYMSIPKRDDDDDCSKEVPYSEIDTQIGILESKPLSFLIVSKPGMNEEKLGRQLAEYWQCVYIEPQLLIEQEIKSGSRAGQCIEFNLRCGRSIGIDIILRLVEKRVNTESSKHRGFVICGLPLVPSETYVEELVTTESAVFTAKEIIHNILDVTVEKGKAPSSETASEPSVTEVNDQAVEEEGEPEEMLPKTREFDSEVYNLDEPVIAAPKEIPIDLGDERDVCQPPEISTDYESQLNFLLNLFNPPFIMIYMMCSPSDCILRRKNTYFHIYSNTELDLITENTNKLLYNIYEHPSEVFKGVPQSSFETYFHKVALESTGLSHLVVLPCNFPANVETQLDIFHYTASNFLERRIMTHDPDYFFKVDARTSTKRMLHIIKNRLNVLSVMKPVIPQRITQKELVSPNIQTGEGDEAIATLENVPTTEDPFEALRYVGIPSKNFNWNWSNWGKLCPVTLKKGKAKRGSLNFAVHFLNKIFFLANEEAYLKFYRNPRPYLKGLCPQNTCKFFVFGPPASGKSAICDCLAYLMGATVLRTESIHLDCMEQKEKEFYEQLREALTAEAIQMLDEQRKNEAEIAEAARYQEIKEWSTKVKDILLRLEDLQIDLENELKGQTKFELSSFPMAMAKFQEAELETETTMSIRQAKDELVNLNIPSMEIKEYSQLLHQKNKVFVYMPHNLRKKITPKPATNADDFVIEYVNEIVAKTKFPIDQSLIEEEMTRMMIDSIQQVEDAAVSKGNLPGGWIINGMHCELNILNSICSIFTPNNVVVLKDTGNYNFLRERYKIRGANEYRRFRDFFAEIGKHDAALRSPSQESDFFYKNTLAKGIISELFESPKLGGRTQAGKLVRDENYYDELKKFHDQWPQAEEFFINQAKDIIELIVTNKTLPELMKEAIKKIENLSKLNASPLTEKDRAEEIVGFTQTLPPLEQTGEETLTDISSVSLPKIDDTPKTPKSLRRYGDTFHYCPVTFYESWVLWKGKEEFAAKFADRVYLLSNEKDFEKFLTKTELYVSHRPPEKIPPPRICVIGTPSSGKTHLARALADNYGIAYVSYESLLKSEFNAAKDSKLETLKRNPFLDERFSAYLKDNALLPDTFYKQNIASLWFKEPIKELGFVLDDFPKRPCDVDVMVQLKLIPDIVIDIVADDFVIKNNLIQSRLETWQDNLSVYILEKEKEYQGILHEWEKLRSKKFKKLLETRREERYEERRKRKEAEQGEQVQEEVEEKTDSEVSFDSIADQEDIDEINRDLDTTKPQVTPESEYETADDMRDKITSQITEHFEIELNYLKLITSSFGENYIPSSILTIDDTDFEKNIRHIYYLTEDFKYRNLSCFESCYDVSFNLAERLISYGCCFLSKFGRLCPVGYRENKNPFLKFPNANVQSNTFPIIHRSYIYFIEGKENVKKFKKNPLLYVNIDKVEYPIVPIKVAVTGPPKCGKTTLANKIGREFGMKVVSRGQAIRYVLRFLPYSNLASTMQRILRKGWEITDEMVAKCIQAVTISTQSSIQGVVFDGFPNTIIETRQLANFGLIPHLVIDLQAKQDQTLECYSHHEETRRGFPKYNLEFIKHLRQEWKGYVNDFQSWFDREYQLMYKIPIEPSLWSIWYDAKKLLTSVAFDVKHYHINCHKDWPLRLSYMQVTPLEFLERKSAYDSFCPCCYLLHDVLTTGGSPPDRTGLVQWRKYYYWICNEHIDMFLKNPRDFVSPYGRPPPEYLPSVLNLKVSKLKNLYEDGYCAKCYKEHTILVKGVLEYAIYYRDKTYLFDTLECLQEFLKRPLLYCIGIRFRPPDNYPGLGYKDLPVLGMLEQYVAKEVIDAIKFVSRRRPIVPGLSVSASAAIGLGLYLKVSNPKLPTDYIARYQAADKLYYSRIKKLLNYLDMMKKIMNPYLHYEEPLPPYHYVGSSNSSETSSTYTHMAHLVENVVDKVCIYEESEVKLD